MEKEKYYTPSIEEFHVGFECEVMDVHESMDELSRQEELKVFYNQDYEAKVMWKTKIFDEKDGNRIEFLKLNPSWIEKDYRVKYLDSTDIESFGFKQISEEVTYFSLNNFNLFFHYTKPIILIDQRVVGSNGGYSDYRVFKGLIKNKSELALVLKMIGVI